MPKKQQSDPGVPVRVPKGDPYPNGVPVAVPSSPSVSETTSASKSGQKAATTTKGK